MFAALLGFFGMDLSMGSGISPRSRNQVFQSSRMPSASGFKKPSLSDPHPPMYRLVGEVGGAKRQRVTGTAGRDLRQREGVEGKGSLGTLGGEGRRNRAWRCEGAP